MSYTEQMLDEVRAQLAPTDDSLSEARKRRKIVLDAAEGFTGALKTFVSGSLAHGTANCPVHQRDKGLDADGGVVLDRRTHPQLGPDGDGEGPDDIVAAVRANIMPKGSGRIRRRDFHDHQASNLDHVRQPVTDGRGPDSRSDRRTGAPVPAPAGGSRTPSGTPGIRHTPRSTLSC